MSRIIINEEYLSEDDIQSLGLEEATDDMGPSFEDIQIARLKSSQDGEKIKDD